MMYLIAFFVPPLSFFLCGKIFSGIFASIIYIAAFFLYLLMGLGGFMHLGLIIWAMLSYNNYKNEKQLKNLEKRILDNKMSN